MKSYSVIIVGGGMVGSTLGCLLAKQGLDVAVIEAFEPNAFAIDDAFDLRVSAISPFSRQTLEQAGAWHHISHMRVSAYEAMHVWDASGDGVIRFDAAEIGMPQLGHIIENRVVQLGLLSAMQELDNLTLYSPSQLTGFQMNEHGSVTVTLNTGEILQARLLVGADGARSKVRELAGISVTRNDYGQKGLVTVVETEHAHQATAWQCFMPSGPLAFLPLENSPQAHRCSIVWTLPTDKADAHLYQSEEVFRTDLGEAFQHRLGKVVAVGERAAFPLKGSQADEYVKPGIALIGDAAHTIHPLAGLGVNLGIKDAAKLAEVLQGVHVDKLGDYQILRRYERARRGDNVLTMKTMEVFRSLFGNVLSPWVLLRNKGLNTVNQLPILKNELIRQAIGQ
jgi:2-octaprenylphenol hydroxylase